VPPLHDCFLENGPCQWILETIELCGQAANPMMMFVLGANLASSEEEADTDDSDESGSDSTATQLEIESYKVVPLVDKAGPADYERTTDSTTRRSSLTRIDRVLPGRIVDAVKLSHRVALVSALIRMVVVPSLSYGLFRIVDASPIPWKGTADPVLTFVSLLQACVPGAIQLILIADYAKAGPRVSKALGELLLWQHILCPLTMSLFIAFFLMFAGVEKDIASDMETFPKNEREVETAFQLLTLGRHLDGL